MSKKVFIVRYPQGAEIISQKVFEKDISEYLKDSGQPNNIKQKHISEYSQAFIEEMYGMTMGVVTYDMKIKNACDTLVEYSNLNPYIFEQKYINKENEQICN